MPFEVTKKIRFRKIGRGPPSPPNRHSWEDSRHDKIKPYVKPNKMPIDITATTATKMNEYVEYVEYVMFEMYLIYVLNSLH